MSHIEQPLIIRQSFKSVNFAHPNGVALVQQYAHGLATTPKLVTMHAVCLTASEGYAVGDEITLGTYGSSGLTVLACGGNATNVFYCGNGTPVVPRKSDAVFVNLTPANWNLFIRAYI